MTRAEKWETLDDDLPYTGKDLDRKVVNKSQIRTVILEFQNVLYSKLFPRRSGRHVPKTLIFAKDDSHANDIVDIVREVFGEGNDFCKKVTYQGDENPKSILSQFRNDYYPRIAVTVDMIATGTDMKPLEYLVFMRDVRSANYFEQMKGRGTRTIDVEALKRVTPDAKDGKQHYILVDAIGVTSSMKVISGDFEKKPGVSLKELLQKAALSQLTADEGSSLARCLVKLGNVLTNDEQAKIAQLTGGKDLKSVAKDLHCAFDPDNVSSAATAEKIADPNLSDDEAKAKTEERLQNEATKPFTGVLNQFLVNEWNWQILKSKTGTELKDCYEKLLAVLGSEPGMLGQMFLQAKNHIGTPARLAGVIDMIIGRETWSGMNTDLKGDIYEELLAKTAEDKKSDAGQYFTARALMSAIMQCVRPQPGETICDPARGTGGFFLKAYEYILERFADTMNVHQKKFLRDETFSGNEIVPTTRRLCLMNMYLHNMGTLDGAVPIELKDALVSSPSTLVKIVATNPPFGKKTAQTVINEEGEESKEKQIYNRQDFWCVTSNKQLNFVQHIRTLLRTDGRAAVVLPDNVLFEKGAGETIRRKLMDTMDLHTILRLPTGIFYAQGVRANVLFFDARPASKNVQTKEVWVYDYRTNIHHTFKPNPMREEDLADFVKCYNPENRHKRHETWSESNPDGRWRKFSYDEIVKREATNLDFKWIKEKSDSVEDVSLSELIDELKSHREAYAAAINGLDAALAEVGE